MTGFWGIVVVAVIIWLVVHTLNLIAGILWSLIKKALDKKSKKEPDHE
jgi:hypothetical protein